MRYTLICVLMLLVLAVTPAHAMQPAEFAPVADSGGMTCSNVERLAGILETEAGTTPSAAHPLIAAIVVSEAHSRGMDVCALSERTWFVSVWHVAQAYPQSWTAAQFAAPQGWAVDLAKAQLMRAGDDGVSLPAHHFDGAA